jgi:hypothetical protein
VQGYKCVSHVAVNLAWCDISPVGQGQVPHEQGGIDAAFYFSLHDVTDSSIFYIGGILCYFGFISVEMSQVYIRKSNRVSWTQEDLNNAMKAVTEEKKKRKAWKKLIYYGGGDVEEASREDFDKRQLGRALCLRCEVETK